MANYHVAKPLNSTQDFTNPAYTWSMSGSAKKTTISGGIRVTFNQKFKRVGGVTVHGTPKSSLDEHFYYYVDQVYESGGSDVFVSKKSGNRGPSILKSLPKDSYSSSLLIGNNPAYIKCKTFTGLPSTVEFAGQTLTLYTDENCTDTIPFGKASVDLSDKETSYASLKLYVKYTPRLYFSFDESTGTVTFANEKLDDTYR